MDRVRNNDVKEIPLFVLPHVIAKEVLKTGDRIYRISVKRTHWHHYHVSVRTKSLPRELAPARKVIGEQENVPVHTRHRMVHKKIGGGSP